MRTTTSALIPGLERLRPIEPRIIARVSEALGCAFGAISPLGGHLFLQIYPKLEASDVIWYLDLRDELEEVVCFVFLL